MQITRNHAKDAEIFQIEWGLNPVTRVTEREFSRGQGRPCDPGGRAGRGRVTAKGVGAPRGWKRQEGPSQSLGVGPQPHLTWGSGHSVCGGLLWPPQEPPAGGLAGD